MRSFGNDPPEMLSRLEFHDPSRGLRFEPADHRSFAGTGSADDEQCLIHRKTESDEY
jgi:hypothetical protein